MNFRSSICAVLVGGFAASTAFADVPAMQTVASPFGDKDITSRVETRLGNYPDLGTTYSVHTRHGVVFIDGIFTTGLMKATAEELAQEVSGVKKVVDLAGISK
jgi:osmotically-inducible protein OsmY